MKMKRFVSLLCAMVCLLALLGVPSAFADTPNPNRLGSVTVSWVTPDGTPVPGAEFTVYQVALVTLEENRISYIPTSAFASCTDIDLSYPIEKLLSCVKTGNVTGRTGVTDENGLVVFDSEQPGIYLVCQTGKVPGFIDAEPFIVALPDDSDGDLQYDVLAKPKAIRQTYTTLTVKKVWDGGDAEERPDRITVYLLQGKETVEQVELHAGNDWTYTWYDLPYRDDYSVREKSVDGFYATYTRTDDTVTITNTPTLITTGQTVWHIYLFGIVGLLLFALGWLLLLGKKAGQKNA